MITANHCLIVHSNNGIVDDVVGTSDTSTPPRHLGERGNNNRLGVLTRTREEVGKVGYPRGKKAVVVGI